MLSNCNAIDRFVDSELRASPHQAGGPQRRLRRAGWAADGKNSPQAGAGCPSYTRGAGGALDSRVMDMSISKPPAFRRMAMKPDDHRRQMLRRQ